MTSYAHELTTVWLGPDGLPVDPDHPVVTAERASRLADELAAMVEQLINVMACQLGALALAGPGAPEPVRADRIADARRINLRTRRTLYLLRDCLGEQHVECDELADQLRHLLRDHADTAVPEGADPERCGYARYYGSPEWHEHDHEACQEANDEAETEELA